MKNKISSSVSSTRLHSCMASVWASLAVTVAVLPTLCHTLGYQAANTANQVMTAGPIEDALEYLLWLLRNA